VLGKYLAIREGASIAADIAKLLELLERAGGLLGAIAARRMGRLRLTLTEED
jgi:hypothetical protein